LAYPTILTVVNTVPAEQQFWGPYVYAGVRFMFGFKAGSGEITVARSADAGNTWTEADAANARPRGTRVITFATCPDAAYPATPKIYVVFLQTGTNLFRLATFDVSTETWGAAITDIQSALGFTAGSPSPGTDENSWFIAHRAADNTVVMFVSAVRETITTGAYWRCQYALCDLTGAAWSAYTQVGTAGGDFRSYWSNACIAGAGGLTHFFYRKSVISAPPTPPTPSTGALTHVSLSLGGALSTPQTIIAELTSLILRRTSNPIARVESGDVVLYLPFRRLVNPNTYQVEVVRGVSIADPVFQEIIISSGPQLPTPPNTALACVCLFDDAGTLVAMWGLNSFNGGGAVILAEIHQSLSADGITWPADTLFYTGPVDNSIDAAHVGGAHVSSFAFAAILSDGITDTLDYWDGQTTALGITCDNPPDGVVGVPYSHFFPAVGGAPPYTFAIIAGALPDGLSLDTGTGEAAGTPTLAGSFVFTVEVTDADLNTAQVECSIDIVSQVWSIIGFLPDGLTLNPDTGEVSGVPTVPGVFPFTVSVTNSSSVDCDSPPDGIVGVSYSHSFPAVFSSGDGPATVDCSITIDGISIGCGDPPNGKVNAPYSHSFPVEGGVAPLDFEITDGALPSGLDLLAPDGTVEGTPTAAGLYTFEVTVTDSADNVASVGCQIRICPMNAKGS
jgi:hypothetical protein